MEPIQAHVKFNEAQVLDVIRGLQLVAAQKDTPEHKRTQLINETSRIINEYYKVATQNAISRTAPEIRSVETCNCTACAAYKLARGQCL